MRWTRSTAVVAGLMTNKPLTIAVLAVVGLPIALVASNSQTGNAFVAAALADPLSVLAGRSPGERRAGALAQSKPVAAKPTERVLSNIRTRPPLVAPGKKTNSLVPTGIAPGLIDLSPVAGGVVGAAAPLSPVINGGGGGGVGFIAGPGFVTGGSAGSGPGTSPTPDAPDVVTVVPEPQTWFMMIAGFFFIASALRSRRRELTSGAGSLHTLG